MHECFIDVLLQRSLGCKGCDLVHRDLGRMRIRDSDVTLAELLRVVQNGRCCLLSPFLCDSYDLLFDVSLWRIVDVFILVFQPWLDDVALEVEIYRT